MKHVHHDLIVKWATDTTQVVECKDVGGFWYKTANPFWDSNSQYRIRHKHQDLIDRKAARPELIVKYKNTRNDTWCETDTPDHWFSTVEYCLVEPLKTVKMWKWVFNDKKYDASRLTYKHYRSESELIDRFPAINIIQRADWTEIEVFE